MMALSDTFADLDFECQAASSEIVWKPDRHVHICRRVHEGDTAKASKGLLHLFIFILFDFFCFVFLSHQITKPAKNRLCTDRPLFSFRGCLLEHLFQNAADDEKKTAAGLWGNVWEATVSWTDFRCYRYSGEYIQQIHVILNQQSIHGCWGFWLALGNRSKRKTVICALPRTTWLFSDEE